MQLRVSKLSINHQIERDYKTPIILGVHPKIKLDEAENKKLSEMEEERKTLPVYRRREQFLKAVETTNLLVVNGGAFSGKGTQLPQYLHEAGYTKKGKVGFAQPSDLSALIMARRVSEEMGAELGQEVGYSTPFQVCTSDKTVIEYMTDKMLLQVLIHDRKLTSYSVLILDQVHRRTVSTDLLLGFLKKVAVSRSDLKVIISGVFPYDDIVGYCDYSPVFLIRDKTPSVQKIYMDALVPDYIITATAKIIEIHVDEPSGDILVFFQGQQEVELAEAILKFKVLHELVLSPAELIICPVFANLSCEIQSKIYEPTPAGARKVFLLSEIVDAYLIDGISYVIDTGMRKIKGYKPMSGIESWFSFPISKASAKERVELCGGRHLAKCYRLYPQSNMNYMLEDTMPEIKMAGLTHAALILKCLGVPFLKAFDFMEIPPTEHLLEAVDLLYALGAVDDVGKITEMGKKMAEFPLDPMLSKMIVASEKYNCSSEIITIAAMLSVESSPFHSTIADQVRCDNARMSFYTGDGGDHIALLKVYTCWEAAGFTTKWCKANDIQVDSMKRARAIRDCLEGVLERINIQVISNPNANDLDGIKKAITAGFFLQAAKLQKSEAYRMIIKRQNAFLYPSPTLPEMLPRCIIYHEVVGEQGLALRQITEVKREWLVEVAPRYYQFDHLKKVVGVGKLPRGQWSADIH